MSTINLPEFVKGSRKMLENLEAQRKRSVEVSKTILTRCIESAVVPKIMEKYPQYKGNEVKVVVDNDLSITIFFLLPAMQGWAVIFDREEVTIINNPSLESFSIPNVELEEID